MSSLSPRDRRWLDAAARSAHPFLGTTAENPTVGAFVVDEARQMLLGRGVTARGGRPHAETQALSDAGDLARGATLYVTLEPCNHYGRTPPCTDAIVRAGISRVVIGLTDPDPRTAGAGAARLTLAGLDVTIADHQPSQRLHEGFITRQLSGRPFVTAKLAVSSDGMIGRRDAPRLQISGEVASRWTHMQRALSDAVMIGAATAEIDDPRLTVRLPGLEKRLHRRVVVVGSRAIDTRIDLIAGVSATPTVLIVPEGMELNVPKTVETIQVLAISGRPNLVAALQALGSRGISSVLVEGGALLIEALLAAGLVDRFCIIQSPSIVGPGGVPATLLGPLDGRLAAAGLAEVDHWALGEDNLRTFERV